jgi:hypothetical protein
VTRIELTDEQASVLKQGFAVRVSVPELGGDVVIVLAAQSESTESVLQEALDEIREGAALSELGQRAAVSWMKENPYGWNRARSIGSTRPPDGAPVSSSPGRA